jgi:hypothetical protein
MAGALLSAGRPVQFRVYPDVGHGRLVEAFSPPLARGVPVMDDVLQFVVSAAP